MINKVYVDFNLHNRISTACKHCKTLVFLSYWINICQIGKKLFYINLGAHKISTSMDVDRVSWLFWKDILGGFTNKIETVTSKKPLKPLEILKLTYSWNRSYSSAFHKPVYESCKSMYCICWWQTSCFGKLYEWLWRHQQCLQQAQLRARPSSALRMKAQTCSDFSYFKRKMAKRNVCNTVLLASTSSSVRPIFFSIC